MGKTYQSITIDAPADDVWALVRNFHDFSWARGIIETCQAVGDAPGHCVGARRVLNGAFHETLVAIDDLDRSLRYTIDDGPSPVSRNDVANYVGALKVYAITEEDRAFVEWSSTWDGNDEDAASFCGTIYTSLLASLANRFS